MSERATAVKARARAATLLILTSVGVSLVPISLYGTHAFWASLIAIGSFALASLLCDPHKRRIILVTGSAYAVPGLFGLAWPTSCFTACVGFYIATIKLDNKLRPPARSSSLKMIAAGFFGLCAGLLLVWHVTTVPGKYQIVLPVAPLDYRITLALFIAVALMNAVGEELLWRRVVDNLWGNRKRLSCYSVQIATFGIAHYHGIPSGLPGILASGAYSGALYFISRQYGFKSALMAHIVTDLTLFVYLTTGVQFEWQS